MTKTGGHHQSSHFFFTLLFSPFPMVDALMEVLTFNSHLAPTLIGHSWTFALAFLVSAIAVFSFPGPGPDMQVIGH